MRRLFVLLPVILVAACSKPAPAPDPVRAVRVTTVAPQSAVSTIDYAGEVKARTESRLSFRVGGKIVSRSADLGDVVKAGQVLARIDAQDLRLGQEAAQAGMASAQASFDQSAADLQRFKELRDQGFISSAELERRETARKAAQAQLDQARAQAGVQGNQATYATLAAGATGVITGVDAEPGMVVAAGTPVLRLAHAGPRDVVFAVPEDKVALIRQLAGQKDVFKVRLWANGAGAPIAATVREVAAAADPVSRTFVVKADIGSAGDTAQLGQTATVTVGVPPTMAGVIKLPLSALKHEQGRTVVWVVDRTAMTVAAQPVVIAGADGNDAIIGSGLQPGATVVTAGVHVLVPGQKVKWYVEPGAAAASAAATAALNPNTSAK